MNGWDLTTKMRVLKKSLVLCFLCSFLFSGIRTIPQNLLYPYDVPEAVYLPKDDDISSGPIKLKEPIVFFGVTFDTIYVSLLFFSFSNNRYSN